MTSAPPSNFLKRYLAADAPPWHRYLATGIVVLIAVVLAYFLWYHFFRAPWTRDGRVRVEVVNVAAQINGQVDKLFVIDNQRVKIGDPLFEIEQIDYQLALTQAESTVKTRQFDLKIAQADAERRQKLGEAVSTEERVTYTSNADVAAAAYEAAVAARDQAKVNLDRTIIKSPVNGYVTNLTLRIGDYATPGQTKLTLVDSDSFWIAGYFEETKLPNIHVNDYAHVRLMGWGPEIAGHVQSIARGISDTDAGNGFQGLQSVNPIFTWVRLAQRIPVRITIDHVPDKVTIAAGQTCTIVVTPPRPEDNRKEGPALAP
jgi:multidrug resistance efflux pump